MHSMFFLPSMRPRFGSTYKFLLTLRGEDEYQYHFNESDELSTSQKSYAEAQLRR